MKIPKIFFPVITISALILIFQIENQAWGATFTGQNEMRYARRGHGDINSERNNPWSGNWGYFENELELNVTQDKLRLHLRQRYLMPSEFGINQSGLKAFDKKYIEYRDDYLTVRGGDFYRNWGRGLLLGMTEVKDINYDTGLQGLLVEGSWEGLEGAVFRGVELDTAGIVQESAEGLTVSYRLPTGIRMGGALLHMDKGLRHQAFDRRGLEGELPFDIGSIYAAYVTDSFDPLSRRYYHGFYSAAELYGAGWGLVFDYKNYTFPPFGQPVLQYPPPVSPEVTFSLLDRYPHTSYYESEVGCQLDFTGSLDDWTLKFNVNQLSQQDGLSILPSLRDRLLPFWATSFQIEKYQFASDRWGLFGGYSEQTRQNFRYGGGLFYERRMSDRISTIGEVQYLWNEELGFFERGFRDVLFSLSGSVSRLGSLTLLVERSGDEWDFSGTKLEKESVTDVLSKESYWPSVEMVITAVQKHQLRLFYGYERGGTRCSGGLCRQVNPFKGVKVMLTSQL